MLATVGFERLDMFRTPRDQTGRRKYIQPKLSAEDFARVQQGILFGLGLHGHRYFLPRITKYRCDCSRETVEPQDPERGQPHQG